MVRKCENLFFTLTLKNDFQTPDVIISCIRTETIDFKKMSVTPDNLFLKAYTT